MNPQNIIASILAFISSVAGLLHSPQTLTFQDVAYNLNPLSISAMRERDYLGSDIVVEDVLSSTSSYTRSIVSYKSDGLKVYALMLIPKGEKPVGGWPVIVVNHGYIIPEKYTSDGNYEVHVDAFARGGYIVFKPDYRGHGQSEGSPTSQFYSPDYTVDNLNAISSIKKYPDANPNKIGVWGHSMGGNIVLRDLVINRRDIKAASIWAGVVGSVDEIMNNWQNRVSYEPDWEDLELREKYKDILTNVYGIPDDNPGFWKSVDPVNYTNEITTPVQIQVGTNDNQVPYDFSSSLNSKLKSENKVVEYFEYPGADHNISQNFSKAMKRTIDFFNRYLKED